MTLYKKEITFRDAYLAFLRTDKNAVAAAIEPVNATFVGHCPQCEQPHSFGRRCRKRKDRPDLESNPGHPYFMKGVLTTTLPSRFAEESSTPTDGIVIYSQAVGSIHFLSTCRFFVTINNVLLVPLLTSDLFSPNKLANPSNVT
jgi:hypothetical protein